MEETGKQELLAKAKRLEGKQMFVKAAEIYSSIEMDAEAAKAYESAGAFDKAIAIFEKTGKKEDAARCRKKRDAASSGQTWQDMQADFQHDSGNPY
ncbi:MAG: hypothetical protein WCT52_00710 [Candidatus Micrarchaeia archaeon]